MSKILKLMLIVTVAVLSGCATQKVITVTPESVQNKGLLIGHVSSSRYDSGRGATVSGELG